MHPQAGRSGGKIVPIESAKSRSLAAASAEGRPRAPWSVSSAAVARWLWFVPMDSTGQAAISTKQVSKGSYVPRYGRFLRVRSRNCR